MDGDTFQLVGTREIFEPLKEWLASKNLQMVKLPPELMDEDDLPTYIVGLPAV